MSEYNDFEQLINEFIQQRDEIKKMIIDLEKIKEKIDSLFGNTLDKRYVRFFEERVKTMTELFRVILDMRKEIIKNTKDEFELRRKMSGDDSNGDLDNLFDIKKIAERVEKLNNLKNRKIEKITDVLDQPDNLKTSIL